MAIPNIITRQHIISAINRIGSPNNIPSIRQPRKLALRYNNRNYSLKYLVFIAHEIATGRELSYRDFINSLGDFTIIKIQD
jgi:hypothetical protein